MNPKLVKSAAFASVLSAVLLLPMQGQLAPQSPANDEKETDATSTRAKKSDSEDREGVVQLSPFVVTAENAQRYLASSTLAGTRVRTDLNDIGASITVVTKEFLQDTASKNSEDLLVYTTNTEIGGVNGNFGGMGNGSSLFEKDRFVAPNTNTRVRGLFAADNTRNYFSSNVPWDSYNTSEITISRGANSVLFGLGSPAGIINNSTSQAEFKDVNKLEWSMGEYDSQRFVLDLNKVIIADELAVRVVGLSDHANYRQRPAYRDDQRLYAALKYSPKFLSKPGMFTSLSVTYEQGAIHSNNPRILPPVDKISPWFTAMNKLTLDNRLPAPAASSQPWLAPEGIQGGPRIIFPDAGSGVASPNYIIELTPTAKGGLNSSGSIDGNVLGLTMPGVPDALKLYRIGAYWNYSRNAGLPFSTSLNPYKDIYLRDSSTFDFYNQLLDGSNKAERRKFDVLTADLTQTFWNNRLGLQAMWALERYEDGFYGIMGDGGPGDTSVAVDVNRYLPDGSANPNLGRPMVESYSGGGRVNFWESKNSRYTGFAEVAASDFMADSWLTRALGKHRLTAAYTIQDDRNTRISFNRVSMPASYQTAAGGTASVHNSLPMAGFVFYVGPDIRGAGSASGLHLANVGTTKQLNMTNIRFWDSTWAKPINPAAAGYVNPSDPWTGYNGTVSTQSENPANYVGWRTAAFPTVTADYDNYRNNVFQATKGRLNNKSSVFVWQAFLLDGDLIPTFSIRKDDVKTYTKTAPRRSDNTYDVDSPSFVLGNEPAAAVSSTIRSWSIVAHTPKKLRERFWGRTDLALTFNKSQNFQVQAGRVDLYGDPVPNPSGKTQEYGAVLTTWNNKLRFKVAKYETELENARLSGAYNEFVIGLSTHWLYTGAKRLQLGLSGDPQYSVANSGYAFNLAPFPGVSEADTRAKQQAIVSAVLAPGALPSDKFFTAWKMDKNKSSNWTGGLPFDFSAPPGITATQFSKSEGWEFEIDFQPTKNWTVTANASKDSASYTAVAQNFVSTVNQLQAIMEGPGGEMGYAFDYSTPGVSWGRGAALAQQTLWNQFFFAPWKLILAQQDTNLPEIRPWRFNLVTNYEFDSQSRFKGWNVGAAYRWGDKVAIGYPVYRDTARDTDTYDIAQPYYGPKESHLDVWVGYQRKLWRDRVDWRIQLNVRDVGTSPNLVPISSQPDGSFSAMRISLGQSVRLTNTFTF